MAKVKNRHAKKSLLFSQSNICWICGAAMVYNEATLDHIVPRAYGGNSALDNLTLAHGKCNNARGLLFVKDTLEVMNEKANGA